MRLRTRFVVALLLAAVVLSALSAVGFAFYRDAVVAQEQTELVRTSETIATQLDVLLSEKAEVVQLWAAEPSVGTHGTTAQEQAITTLVERTGFSGASVIAANGTMTAITSRGMNDSEAAALVGHDFSDRTYYRRAIDGETYVSDPVDAESGNRIVTVSTPIRVDGVTVGTLNAAFHVSDGDLFESVRERDARGRGIAIYSDSSIVYADGPTSSDPETVGTANTTVARTGWVVSATRTPAAVDERLQTVTILQSGTIALVVLSLAAFGAWLYREYVGNFERLQTGFMALDDGNYGRTVDLRGPREWTDLGEQFNDLSETLARRRVEVTVLNRVLRHNLRNAMTVVAGNAERIARRADDEGLISKAELIRRRGESLLDLADHARVVESSLRIDREESPPRPVGAIVQEAATVLTEEFPEVSLTVDGAATTAWVPDGDMVAVVVDELLRNAVIHGGEDADVDLTIDVDDEVTVAVTDEGPGLPAVERRVLTERFVETPTEHGSGLGLWVVKWIVEWLDGDIVVETGDGTTVTVHIPVAERDGADGDGADDRDRHDGPGLDGTDRDDGADRDDVTEADDDAAADRDDAAETDDDGGADAT